MRLLKILGVALPVIILLILTPFFLKGSFAKGQENFTEKTYYFLTDHLGSIDVVLDDQGKIVERADYLPYGSDRLRVAEQVAPDTDYKFTGKELDDETGLMYYGARYYDPAIGRFISFDPLLLNEGGKPLESVLSNPQALNPYSYVTNNPVRFVDETGEYASDVHYDLTFFLSLIAGLNYGQSKTIATFDQYTDDNPATLPSNFKSVEGTKQSVKNAIDGTTNKYHFAPFGTALKNLGEAVAGKPLDKFGETLHTFQDTYSHANLTPVTHFFTSTLPDQTYLAPAKAMSMAHFTFNILRGFNLILNGSGGKTSEEYGEDSGARWLSFGSQIESYIKTIDKSDTFITKLASQSKENLVISSPNKKEETISSK